MKLLRSVSAVFLCLLLLLSAAAPACAGDEPFSVPVYIGTGCFYVRCYADSFANNLYLSLSDLSAAFNATPKQFSFSLQHSSQDGDMFILTGGQPAAGPSLAPEAQRPSVTALYTQRNRLFLDGRELKYYTHREGSELYMNLTDIQLVFDVAAERETSGALRFYPERPFTPDLGQLAADGFFSGCSAILLADAETGEALFSLSADAVYPVASLSKLMVYLIAAEAINARGLSLNEPIPISEAAEALSLGPNGMIPFKAGTAVPLTELLDAMLLASSNESALALAEYFGGSDSAFVELMNRRAAELGLYDAVFLSPHGLPVYTANAVAAKLQNSMSARSLFLLVRCILERYPVITQRTGRTYASFPSLDYASANSNALVFNLPGVNGLKTGNTTRAGYCLVSTLPVSVGTQTHSVVCIVLGAETPALRNQISQILLRYAERYYAQNGFPATG